MCSECVDSVETAFGRLRSVREGERRFVRAVCILHSCTSLAPLPLSVLVHVRPSSLLAHESASARVQQQQHVGRDSGSVCVKVHSCCCVMAKGVYMTVKGFRVQLNSWVVSNTCG